MATFWRAAEQVFVAALLCVVAVAVSVAVLTSPAFTRVVTHQLGVASGTGLSAQRASATAELVRRFVTTRDAVTLPTVVDRRGGFDAGAIAHLEDVREVVIAARLAGLFSAAVVLAWAALSWRRRRLNATARGLRSGGYLCVAAPIVAAVVGIIDFEALFTAFHGLFFAEGTWTFPADSLLIELFPERFWMIAGVSLALLVMVQGAAFLALGVAIGRRRREAGRG